MDGVALSCVWFYFYASHFCCDKQRDGEEGGERGLCGERGGVWEDCKESRAAKRAIRANIMATPRQAREAEGATVVVVAEKFAVYLRFRSGGDELRARKTAGCHVCFYGYTRAPWRPASRSTGFWGGRWFRFSGCACLRRVPVVDVCVFFLVSRFVYISVITAVYFWCVFVAAIAVFVGAFVCADLVFG